jgi:hypothetical protein
MGDHRVAPQETVRRELKTARILFAVEAGPIVTADRTARGIPLG